MDIKQTAEEIYNYMVMKLAEGIYINKEDKEKMIKEICFILEKN